MNSMTSKLRASAQRVNAAAARLVDSAAANLSGFATTGTPTFAWIVMPSVHTTAICTHGKRYERRLQEMRT